MNQALITQQLKALKICVLIPTYNNERTLQRVIDGVLDYTDQVIIVNDGSTDSTAQILDRYPQLQRLDIPKNIGKAMFHHCSQEYHNLADILPQVYQEEALQAHNPTS